MEEIRRLHNDEKRALIELVTQKGDSILDVGCGFGGDLQKWKKVGANINMCEPNENALNEAKSRAKNMKIRVNFYHGDIHSCPNRKYDIVCYNFALHYIFEDRDMFINSLQAVKRRLKPGGRFIGIIPDSEKLIFKTPMTDDMGNFFKSEPLAHKDLLITQLENTGFSMEKWEGLSGNPITELYSKFIFVYRNDSSGRTTHT